MAKTNKTKTAASKAAQETQEIQDMSQDAQRVEDALAAAGEQPAAAQETSFGEAEQLSRQPEAAQGTSFGEAERPSQQPAAAQDLAELSEGLLTGYAVTGCDALNLREGPSLDARVITTIPRDAGVFAGEGPENGWLRVCTGWLTGYMMAEYLKPLPWPVLPHDTD